MFKQRFLIFSLLLQTGDANEWANSLNRFRVGTFDEEDKERLKTRVTQDAFLDTEAIHIFYTNLEVLSHNDMMLDQLDGELITLEAKVDGPKGYTAPKTPDGRIGNTQFFDKLSIKLNARICLTWNLNTPDGLVNGTCGTIIGIEWSSKLSKDRRVNAIIVKLDDDKAGIQQRQKYHRLSKKYEKENGTPIFRHEISYNILSKRGYSHAVTAKVTQFPLRINYACTAHRMQVKFFAVYINHPYI